MLNQPVISVLAGTILGYLAGLGAGGGSLLLLWLTWACGMESAQARVITRMFYLPSALTATLLRTGPGKPPLGPLIPAMISGSVTVLVLQNISLTEEWADLLLGVLFLTVGLKELCYRERKPR